MADNDSYINGHSGAGGNPLCLYFWLFLPLLCCLGEQAGLTGAHTDSVLSTSHILPHQMLCLCLGHHCFQGCLERFPGIITFFFNTPMLLTNTWNTKLFALLLNVFCNDLGDLLNFKWLCLLKSVAAPIILLAICNHYFILWHQLKHKNTFKNLLLIAL